MGRDIRQKCQLALEKLRACRDREVKEYGEQYDEVNRMEDEAPAHDPCMEAYNEVITAILEYREVTKGTLDDLELGRFKEEIEHGINNHRHAESG